jgi:hypothetical protein
MDLDVGIDHVVALAKSVEALARQEKLLGESLDLSSE